MPGGTKWEIHHKQQSQQQQVNTQPLLPNTGHQTASTALQQFPL